MGVWGDLEFNCELCGSPNPIRKKRRICDESSTVQWTDTFGLEHSSHDCVTSCYTAVCEDCWALHHHILHGKQVKFCTMCNRVLWDIRRTTHAACVEAQDTLQIIGMLIESEWL